MGNSYSKCYVHLVWATKYRNPFITNEVENPLHNYIGGICRNIDCPSVAVGGFVDHIHVLCELSPKIPTMTLAQKVKANSSKWIKEAFTGFELFEWQVGYSVFSVDPSSLPRVSAYIKNQHEHHKTKSYEEELLDHLLEHGIDPNSIKI